MNLLSCMSGYDFTKLHTIFSDTCGESMTKTNKLSNRLKVSQPLLQDSQDLGLMP